LKFGRSNPTAKKGIKDLVIDFANTQAGRRIFKLSPILQFAWKSYRCSNSPKTEFL
jgi:hypothetical protein